MKIKAGLIAAILLQSCTVRAPELPRQELPRQEPPGSEIQTRQSTLTPGMVVKSIQKGKTTQAEIIEIFGPPDMVTRSGSGEMWGYDKVSREVAEAATGASVGASSGAVAGGGGGILGLAGGGAAQSAAQRQQQTQQQARRTESTTTVFLLIYYDDKGVVTDYRLSATKF
jgi:hypothetical protein